MKFVSLLGVTSMRWVSGRSRQIAPICPPNASGWRTGSEPWNSASASTGAVDASGGLLADPGHPDRLYGRADRGVSVTQTRSPPPPADQPAAALPAPDQAVAVPERRPACRSAAHTVTAASSPTGR